MPESFGSTGWGPAPARDATGARTRLCPHRRPGTSSPRGGPRTSFPVRYWLPALPHPRYRHTRRPCTSTLPFLSPRCNAVHTERNILYSFTRPTEALTQSGKASPYPETPEDASAHRLAPGCIPRNALSAADILTLLCTDAACRAEA